jgi:hypothetical protein
MLADMDLDEAALSEGRRSLVDRGLLFVDSRRSDSALSPSLEPVLTAVTRPQVLGVLQVTSRDSAPRSAYVSWTPETVVLNKVTEAGDHLLETLPAVEAIGKTALNFSGVTGFKKEGKGMAPDPEAIVRDATLRAVFLAVSDPAAVEPQTAAMSWLVSGDALWLMAGEGETPLLEPATADEVGGRVVSMLNTAIESYRRAQASAPTKKAGGSVDGNGVGEVDLRMGRSRRG